MSNAIKLTALSVAIVLGGMSMAEARDGGHRQPVSFEALDTNADGQITKEEMQARGQARFAEADTNGDGTLSRDELLARAQSANESRVDRMLSRMDTNDDGVLSQEEMQARRGGKDRADKMFDRVDADDSGTISKEEFETAQAKMKDRRSKKKKSN